MLIDTVEVGDLIFGKFGPSATEFPTTGIALRPATAEEIAHYTASPPSSAWWVWTDAPQISGRIIMFDAGVLSIIKSHKTAADDLGPLVGLANPAV